MWGRVMGSRLVIELSGSLRQQGGRSALFEAAIEVSQLWGEV
jgi:hypothetical protein